jgi:hypothetical protein
MWFCFLLEGWQYDKGTVCGGTSYFKCVTFNGTGEHKEWFKDKNKRQ